MLQTYSRSKEEAQKEKGHILLSHNLFVSPEVAVHQARPRDVDRIGEDIWMGMWSTRFSNGDEIVRGTLPGACPRSKGAPLSLPDDPEAPDCALRERVSSRTERGHMDVHAQLRTQCEIGREDQTPLLRRVLRGGDVG